MGLSDRIIARLSDFTVADANSESLPSPATSSCVAAEALAMEGGSEPPDYLDENDKDGTLSFALCTMLDCAGAAAGVWAVRC